MSAHKNVNIACFHSLGMLRFFSEADKTEIIFADRDWTHPLQCTLCFSNTHKTKTYADQTESSWEATMLQAKHHIETAHIGKHQKNCWIGISTAPEIMAVNKWHFKKRNEKLQKKFCKSQWVNHVFAAPCKMQDGCRNPLSSGIMLLPNRCKVNNHDSGRGSPAPSIPTICHLPVLLNCSLNSRNSIVFSGGHKLDTMIQQFPVGADMQTCRQTLNKKLNFRIKNWKEKAQKFIWEVAWSKARQFN